MTKRQPKRQLADWHLWAEVARTIDPLRGKSLPQVIGELPLPSFPPAGKPRRAAVAAMPSYQSDGRPSAPPSRPGIEPRMRRRLGRRQIEIDATIDLHGMRQAEAHAALSRFVHARAGRGDRTLLVITGKGLKKVGGDATAIVERGVLRSMLPIWLSEPRLAPLIAGWDVAAQGHGGEGAYYVRLRRAEVRR